MERASSRRRRPGHLDQLGYSDHPGHLVIPVMSVVPDHSGSSLTSWPSPPWRVWTPNMHPFIRGIQARNHLQRIPQKKRTSRNLARLSTLWIPHPPLSWRLRYTEPCQQEFVPFVLTSYPSPDSTSLTELLLVLFCTYPTEPGKTGAEAWSSRSGLPALGCLRTGQSAPRLVGSSGADSMLRAGDRVGSAPRGKLPRLRGVHGQGTVAGPVARPPIRGRFPVVFERSRRNIIR